MIRSEPSRRTSEAPLSRSDTTQTWIEVGIALAVVAVLVTVGGLALQYVRDRRDGGDLTGQEAAYAQAVATAQAIAFIRAAAGLPPEPPSTPVAADQATPAAAPANARRTAGPATEQSGVAADPSTAQTATPGAADQGSPTAASATASSATRQPGVTATPSPARTRTPRPATAAPAPPGGTFELSGSGSRVVPFTVTGGIVAIRVAIDPRAGPAGGWFWCFDADFGLAPDGGSPGFGEFCADAGMPQPSTGVLVSYRIIQIAADWPKSASYLWRISCAGACAWNLIVAQ